MLHIAGLFAAVTASTALAEPAANPPSASQTTATSDGDKQAAAAGPSREVQRAVLGLESAEIAASLAFACEGIVPKLEQSGDEIEHLLDALEGKYVPAGPAGAPTRGMAHVLPTGRNFYAVDPRALPSQAAWRVGQHLAREAFARFANRGFPGERHE
ncbi:MAG TPA: cobaltochelatase subunit CobN, partial [Pirellulales bacterium]|nr:cobaltochelatase subunit CobN [Pirellulales bacterium]